VVVSALPQHRKGPIDRLIGGIRVDVLRGGNPFITVKEIAAVDGHSAAPFGENFPMKVDSQRRKAPAPQRGGQHRAGGCASQRFKGGVVVIESRALF
jgi:hypothetical protein